MKNGFPAYYIFADQFLDRGYKKPVSHKDQQVIAEAYIVTIFCITNARSITAAML